MPLLLQLDGAVPEARGDRWFYVWACREKTCRRKKGTVRALRAVKVEPAGVAKEKAGEKGKTTEAEKADEEEAAKPAATNIGNTLFGSSATPGGGANPFAKSTAANPFSSSSSSSTTANPFSSLTTASAPKPATAAASSKDSAPSLTKTFAETLKISNDTSSPPTSTLISDPEPLFYGPAEPWPDPYPFEYPRYFLDAGYEELNATPTDLPQKVKVLEEAAGGDDTPMSGTGFESTIDKTFQRFADRVAENPDQVLRYIFISPYAYLM